MDRYASFPRAPLSPPPAGPVTRALCGILVGTTLTTSLIDRSGTQIQALMLFDRNAILHGELWRLLTYGCIKTTPLALMIGTLILWLFGGMHEAQWGSRRFARFMGFSIVGAACIAVPLGVVLGAMLPFADSPYAAGPDAAIDALLMAIALNTPRSQVLFGFVLPVQARTFVWLMVGLGVVTGIMDQVSHLSLTLGGLAMGYLLTTGLWRPQRIIDKLRLYGLSRQRRRRGLYVVPPRRGDRRVN